MSWVNEYLNTAYKNRLPLPRQYALSNILYNQVNNLLHNNPNPDIDRVWQLIYELDKLADSVTSYTSKQIQLYHESLGTPGISQGTYLIQIESCIDRLRQYLRNIDGGLLEL